MRRWKEYFKLWTPEQASKPAEDWEGEEKWPAFIIGVLHEPKY